MNIQVKVELLRDSDNAYPGDAIFEVDGEDVSMQLSNVYREVRVKLSDLKRVIAIMEAAQ